VTDLSPGNVVWVQFDPTVGREQRGMRSAVVVASRGYLAAVPELVIVVPATTRDRDWAHHVRLTGPRLRLPKPTWAMTEQPRTISHTRSATHESPVAPAASSQNVCARLGAGSTTSCIIRSNSHLFNTRLAADSLLRLRWTNGRRTAFPPSVPGRCDIVTMTKRQ
jgi:mRNA interferase MazF